jgi:hypothetical protein
MKNLIHFISAVVGLAMAGLAFTGGLILLKTTAWEAAEMRHKIFTGALLFLPVAAAIAIFIHLARKGRVSGFISGILLALLCAYPLAASFHYLFLEPSSGGLIGGIGALIALAQFLISLFGSLSGFILLYYSFKIDNQKPA